MCGASAGAGARGAVAGVAVVADELDRGREAAGGPRPRAPAGWGPAEVARERSGGGVPDGLGGAVGGDEVDGGAVAVGVVAGFAGGADAQVVAPQDPDDVGVEAGIDRARTTARGLGPGRQRAVRMRCCDVLG